jgi:hypothetical protein
MLRRLWNQRAAAVLSTARLRQRRRVAVHNQRGLVLPEQPELPKAQDVLRGEGRQPSR